MVDMFEWMRKLTAGYTDTEYQEYLANSDNWRDCYEIVQPEGDYLYVPKTEFEPVTELPKLGVVRRMKDIANAITEVALDTGYEPNMLIQLVAESVAEGNTYEEAFNHVTAVSYEHDW